MASFIVPAISATTTAMSVSSSDGDSRRYRHLSAATSSPQNLVHMGNHEGAEVWRDDLTVGVYYVSSSSSNGSAVRVGRAGFVPHPIDREHLKRESEEHHPENLLWVDYLLVTHEHRTHVLWEALFDKYQVGARPKEPAFGGRTLRKSRWAKFDDDSLAWEARRAAFRPRFLQELAEWESQKDQHDAKLQARRKQQAANGAALLQRALSGGSSGRRVASSRTLLRAAKNNETTNNNASSRQLYRARVPENCPPGTMFVVKCGASNISVTIPEGAVAGSELTFTGPATTTKTASAEGENRLPQQQQPQRQPSIKW